MHGEKYEIRHAGLEYIEWTTELNIQLGSIVLCDGNALIWCRKHKVKFCYSSSTLAALSIPQSQGNNVLHGFANVWSFPELIYCNLPINRIRDLGPENRYFWALWNLSSSYFFCLLLEVSGSVEIITRLKNLRTRIRNTGTDPSRCPFLYLSKGVHSLWVLLTVNLEQS